MTVSNGVIGVGLGGGPTQPGALTGSGSESGGVALGVGADPGDGEADRCGGAALYAAVDDRQRAVQFGHGLDQGQAEAGAFERPLQRCARRAEFAGADSRDASAGAHRLHPAAGAAVDNEYCGKLPLDALLGLEAVSSQTRVDSEILGGGEGEVQQCRMSEMGQGQTLTMLGTTSALPLQPDKLGGKRTSRFTMSDYGVTADSRRALSELRLLANNGLNTACPNSEKRAYGKHPLNPQFTDQLSYRTWARHQGRREKVWFGTKY